MWPVEHPVAYVEYWTYLCIKVGSHDENRRSPWYCFLYQGTGVSTEKKNTKQHGNFASFGRVT
jgi:hypothetical protein